MRRFAALVTALALLVGVASSAGAATPRPLAANASAPTAIWYGYYGNGYQNGQPNVYSNRQPTWQVGTNPHLILQPDGNLVIYVGVVAIWASRTNGKPLPTHFVLQGDGNVVIYGHNGVAYWATGTNNGYYQFVMTFWTNGCLTVHSQYYGWHRIWQSSPSSVCNIDIS